MLAEPHWFDHDGRNIVVPVVGVFEAKPPTASGRRAGATWGAYRGRYSSSVCSVGGSWNARMWCQPTSGHPERQKEDRGRSDLPPIYQNGQRASFTLALVAAEPNNRKRALDELDRDVLARSTEPAQQSRVRTYRAICAAWGVAPFPLSVENIRCSAASFKAGGYRSAALYLRRQWTISWGSWESLSILYCEPLSKTWLGPSREVWVLHVWKKDSMCFAWARWWTLTTWPPLISDSLRTWSMFASLAAGSCCGRLSWQGPTDNTSPLKVTRCTCWSRSTRQRRRGCSPIALFDAHVRLWCIVCAHGTLLNGIWLGSTWWTVRDHLRHHLWCPILSGTWSESCIHRSSSHTAAQSGHFGLCGWRCWPTASPLWGALHESFWSHDVGQRSSSTILDSDAGALVIILSREVRAECTVDFGAVTSFWSIWSTRF